MISDKNLCKNLSKLFTNKKFILSIMEEYDGDIVYVFSGLGDVLDYYIAYRDDRFNYTFREIYDKYNSSEHYNDKDMKIEAINIIDNGFMTHSFNGYKKELIARKGLNYEQDLTEEERKEIKERRNLLRQIENILEVSRYRENQRDNYEKYNDFVYVCSPGAKTFHYACKRSPERLYEGPLRGIDKEPIIVGETKSQFLSRVLNKKIRQKGETENWENDKYLEAYEIAKKIGEVYGGCSPAFAMIKNKDISNVKFSFEKYNEKIKSTLIERIEHNIEKYAPRRFFSVQPNDGCEPNNLGDLVTLARFIPKRAIAGVVDCMDVFEMQQIYARSKGLKTGDYIDYSVDKEMGNPTLEELENIIANCENDTQLQELKEKFKIVKDKSKTKIEDMKEQLKERYGEVSISDVQKDLLNKKQELLDKEQEILSRDYKRKDGIDTSYGLHECLQELRHKGLMPELLESDEAIKNDPLQYKSNIHGSSHTRRVNFFATLIIKEEELDQKNAILLRAFVKNHDIGRQNDEEDKGHGARSTAILDSLPERLEGLNQTQIEQLKFAITEHSLSNNQNEEDLDKLFEKKINQGENLWDVGYHKKCLAKFLSMCKDSDKLDRVRLDPYGIDIREGLDVSRLSLESSKKLENIAYESREKILEILDIEKELQSIKQELSPINELQKLQEEYEKADRIEEKFSEQKEKCNQNTEKFLSDMVKEKRFSIISQIPKKIKEIFLRKEKNEEDLRR